MKRTAIVSWLILFAILSTSCQIPGAKIKPGDKLGDIEFINKAADCQAPNLLYDICSEKQLTDGTCEVPASMKTFWVSVGWTAGSWDALELEWKDSEWEMTFEDHEVDLDAFGTYDMEVTDPAGNAWKGRVWNVCISNPPAGKYSAQYHFILRNGLWRGDHVVPLNFTVLAD